MQYDNCPALQTEGGAVLIIGGRKRKCRENLADWNKVVIFVAQLGKVAILQVFRIGKVAPILSVHLGKVA